MSEESPTPGEGATGTESTVDLSQSQRDRIHRNRERAKAIRQARLETKPYDIAQRSLLECTRDTSAVSAKSSEGNGSLNSVVGGQTRVGSSSVACRDTGGGYLLEEEEGEEGGWGKGHRLLEEKGACYLQLYHRDIDMYDSLSI